MGFGSRLVQQAAGEPEGPEHDSARWRRSGQLLRSRDDVVDATQRLDCRPDESLPVSWFSRRELSTTCPLNTASACDAGASAPSSSPHRPIAMNDREASGTSSAACAAAKASGDSWMSIEWANAASCAVATAGRVRPACTAASGASKTSWPHSESSSGSSDHAKNAPSRTASVRCRTRSSSLSRWRDAPEKCGVRPVSFPRRSSRSQSSSPLPGAQRRYIPASTGVSDACDRTCPAILSASSRVATGKPIAPKWVATERVYGVRRGG